MSDYRVAGKCWTPGAHPLFTATPNLLDREPGPNGYTTREWGLARIQRRTRVLTCVRNLPKAKIGLDRTTQGCRLLRKQYEDACGDICPHRGYDLRNVPIDADGYRQCPLHQLRVRVRGAGPVQRSNAPAYKTDSG